MDTNKKNPHAKSALIFGILIIVIGIGVIIAIESNRTHDQVNSPRADIMLEVDWERDFVHEPLFNRLGDSEIDRSLKQNMGADLGKFYNEYEIRIFLREEMFRGEKEGEKSNKPRLFYIAWQQLRILKRASGYLVKDTELIREAAATISRINPELQGFESLDTITRNGFRDYTWNEKIQSEYYLKTELQRCFIEKRLENADSMGALKTALEIIPAPERDTALLNIIKTLFWPANLTYEIPEETYQKAEKAFSHLSPYGKDLGRLIIAQAYVYYAESKDKTGNKRYRTLEKAIEHLEKIEHGEIFDICIPDYERKKSDNIVRELKHFFRENENVSRLDDIIALLESRTSDPYARCLLSKELSGQYRSNGTREIPLFRKTPEEIYKDILDLPNDSRKLKLLMSYICKTHYYKTLDTVPGTDKKSIARAIFEGLNELPDSDPEKLDIAIDFAHLPQSYYNENESEELNEIMEPMLDKIPDIIISAAGKKFTEYSMNIDLPDALPDFLSEESMSAYWEIIRFIRFMISHERTDGIEMLSRIDIPERIRRKILDSYPNLFGEQNDLSSARLRQKLRVDTVR